MQIRQDTAVDGDGRLALPVTVADVAPSATTSLATGPFAAEPGDAAEPAARHAVLTLALLRAMRPKQWIKNLLLFAALLFTLDKPHAPADSARVFLAFVIFCVLSGGTYIVNDLFDVEADRKHPKKRLRPIASGALPVSVARAYVAFAVPVALLCALAFINVKFLLISLTYIGVTLSYSLRLKHIVLLDVLVLASGFVLRAVAGGFALGVPSSEWLLLCTLLLALFLGLVKRRSELTTQGASAGTRRTLSEYSVGLLDQLITIVASTCLMSYALYTFYSETARNRKAYLMATIPFVIYGLFRYLYVSQRGNGNENGSGESPETLLLHDRPLIVNIVLWAIVVLVALLVGRT